MVKWRRVTVELWSHGRDVVTWSEICKEDVSLELPFKTVILNDLLVASAFPRREGPDHTTQNKRERGRHIRTPRTRTTVGRHFTGSTYWLSHVRELLERRTRGLTIGGGCRGDHTCGVWGPECDRSCGPWKTCVWVVGVEWTWDLTAKDIRTLTLGRGWTRSVYWRGSKSTEVGVNRLLKTLGPNP